MRGGGVSELPMATAGETQPSKPGVLQWGDSEGQGDQVSRTNGLGAEKLHYRRQAALCGAPAAQGHRAELDRRWGEGLADPSDPSTARRRSGRG